MSVLCKATLRALLLFKTWVRQCRMYRCLFGDGSVFVAVHRLPTDNMIAVTISVIYGPTFGSPIRTHSSCDDELLDWTLLSGCSLVQVPCTGSILSQKPLAQAIRMDGI